MARVEWGDGSEGEEGEELESSLQSRFNCSFTEEQVGVHLELFSSQIKSQPSATTTTRPPPLSPVGNEVERQGQADERQVNLSVDGTFNKISGFHKAR